ncbi:phycobilisome linker polypeptide [Synechococcus sp. PCC 7336]|uniref:phycobilisome linker polypeptide n=1 Tax=Synechococcus sp. PCC 7336 TaxID=195250 RepID=UPI0003494043|nr:phycobilisome linker polypeptide [Synechococcus sp. PCC 7336]
MGILLAYEGREFGVERLDDTLPSSSETKVMAATGEGRVIPVGARVELKGDGSIEGQYEVVRALSPAAPRGWRFYLNGVASDSAPSGVAASPTAADDGNNSAKRFAIRVSGAQGAVVRQSVQTIEVPFSRLSTEMKRLNRMGGKIESITAL